MPTELGKVNRERCRESSTWRASDRCVLVELRSTVMVGTELRKTLPLAGALPMGDPAERR